MSSHLSHPPAVLSDGEDDDDEAYNPFSDYASSRASLVSDASHIASDQPHWSFAVDSIPSDDQTSSKDSTGRPQSSLPLHPRPVSYNPSRQLPAVDPIHRPAQSLDSRVPPKAVTRQTSWYISDLEEEAPLASTIPSHTIEPPTPLPDHHQQHPFHAEDRSRSPSQDRGRLPETASLLPRPRLERSATSYHTAHDSVSSDDEIEDPPSTRQSPRPLTMSSRGISPKPSEPRGSSDMQDPTPTTVKRSNSKKPPARTGTGFFGWRRSSNNETPESPTTTMSDSSSVSSHQSAKPGDRPSAAMVDDRASSHLKGEANDYFSRPDSYYGLPSPGPEGQHNMVQAEELLTELREISVELAASIRREMELEDEVDRYRSEMPEQSRQTSDYYSDSGASSIGLDHDYKIESLEKLRRKAEQERAQLRLEVSSKAQEELNQRNALESHIQSLEEQLRSKEHAESQNEAANLERVRSLEAAQEHTKRRLSEERSHKENFEDLLNGMRQEIAAYSTERDNLRDEVVPGLRSRLETLEVSSAEAQNLTNENERIMLENQSLRNENQTLVNARRLQLDMAQTTGPRFRSIAEEEEEPLSPRTPGTAGLSRSNSIARMSVRARPSSLHMSKEGVPSSDGPHETHNDVEVQMESMRRTLQSLILKQSHMTRMHEKQLRKVCAERDNANLERRRKNVFYLEIQSQRQDLNHLRRRADDAAESKWQCEKGLAGLKMDLDRALQETGSLQEVLKEKNILVSDRPSSSDGSEEEEEPLDVAFDRLRTLYDSALTTVQATADPEYPDTNIAALLASSTTRLQALSSQVEAQTAFNETLRDRLEDTVTRGMQEQQGAGQRITDLETALRAAEEEVTNATVNSEEAVADHEEHVRTMRATSEEKQRGGLSSAPPTNLRSDSQVAGLGLGLSLTPILSRPFTSRAPRLHHTTSGKGIGVAEASKTEELDASVTALERLARSADGEMHDLLQRMEKARVEVGTLQGERDDAIRKTRRLQREIIEERERLKGLAA